MPTVTERLSAIAERIRSTSTGATAVALAPAPTETTSQQTATDYAAILASHANQWTTTLPTATIGMGSQYYITNGLGGITMSSSSSSPTLRTSAKDPVGVPSAVAPIDADFAADYRTVATDLGLDPMPLDTLQFKGWLAERGLLTYPRADVEEYLHFKYQVPVGNITANVNWGWRPLREADRAPKQAANSRNGSIQRQTKAYAKPIPYPVLLTVRDIREAFPTAKFFVSDEMHAEAIPDPFLMVELGHEQFIVERWDEPSFRGK